MVYGRTLARGEKLPDEGVGLLESATAAVWSGVAPTAGVALLDQKDRTGEVAGEATSIAQAAPVPSGSGTAMITGQQEQQPQPVLERWRT